MKDDQSSLAGGVNRFQTTRWSVVLNLAQSQAPGYKQALADLCKLYWHPLYAFIRHRGYSPEDAQDVNMVALWMIGYEDEPTHSAEICICEIFGRDVGPLQTRVRMGVHPFGDPAITDEFAAETVGIDARGSHTYAAEWTPDNVAFYVDGRLV